MHTILAFLNPPHSINEPNSQFHPRSPLPVPIIQGGIPDIESAARSVLQDWNSGRIPFYTIPPQAGLPVVSHVSSAIVESWSREFEMPEIVATEGKDLSAAAADRDAMSTF